MIYEKAADENRHFFFAKYTPRHSPRFDPMPHFHNSIEVFFVEKGSYTVSIGGEKKTLESADVAFVDPFALHSSGRIDSCEDFTAYVIVVGNEYYSSVEWLRHETLPPFCSCGNGYSALRELFNWGYGMRGGMNEDMRSGFINLLLGTLRTVATAQPRLGVKTNELTVDVIRYLGEHYKDDISLDTLADRFGYEKTYLSRVIGKATGMNLREYLNRIRLSEFNAMKRSMPDAPAYKIAEACGFRSENTFYRCARKYAQNHNF